MYKVTWQSPSNIALIKYWGKKAGQLPMNPSLSLTLSKCYTQTSLKLSAKSGETSKLAFLFEAKENKPFQMKIEKFLANIFRYFDFLKDFDIEIESFNSFPHSSGIASSASSMSALALCLCSAEQDITGKLSEFDNFFQKASFIARLGSGSAARSVYGNSVLWGRTELIENSNDLYAVPVEAKIAESFCDSILVVSSDVKKVSSSAGHELMKTNKYAPVRYSHANENLEKILGSLKNDNIEECFRIIESEALSLHAMFMLSHPGFILLAPNTVQIINKIITYREKNNIPICFTLDAGPNVHIIYGMEHKVDIQYFIETELRQMCENGIVIHDKIGKGPLKIE